MEALIISLVEEHPIIYDRSRGDFKDIRKKENVWRIVAEKSGESPEKVQNIWKSIRDKYVKLRNKEKNIPSGSAQQAPLWEHYKSLDFLNIHIKGRRTSSNVERHNAHQNSTETDITLSDSNDSCLSSDAIFTCADENQDDTQLRSTSTPSPTPGPSTKRVRGNDGKPIDVMAKNVACALTTVSAYMEGKINAEKSKNNSDTAFGNYVGFALSEMTKENKTRSKVLITQILEKYAQ